MLTLTENVYAYTPKTDDLNIYGYVYIYGNEYPSDGMYLYEREHLHDYTMTRQVPRHDG